MKRMFWVCGALVMATAAGFAVAQQDQEKEEGTPPQRREGRPAGERPDGMMRILDADRDGTLSAEEINGAADALRKLDKNSDGAITADELRSRRERPEGEDGRPGRDGARGEGGRPEGMRGGFIMRFDADQDGVVTREEYDKGVGEQFDRVDKNHDGKIDREEAAAAMPGRGGQPGGRPQDGPR
ncbi:MAG: hypothetical protein HZB38_11800 [Planctomycetes bacterium]|nr:hypothetical protein [Planctomycetota bacterium]